MPLVPDLPNRRIPRRRPFPPDYSPDPIDGDIEEEVERMSLEPSHRRRRRHRHRKRRHEGFQQPCCCCCCECVDGSARRPSDESYLDHGTSYHELWEEYMGRYNDWVDTYYGQHAYY